MQQSEYVNALAEARDIFNIFQEILLALQITNNRPSRMAASLSLSILESHLALMVLLDSVTPSFAQSKAYLIVRGAQETLAMLICLNADDKYFEKIIYNDALQTEKLLKGLLRSQFINAADKPKWEAHLAEQSAIIKNSGNRGGKYESFANRFKDAGMEQEYSFEYGLFSSHAHNNMQALLANHGVTGDLEFGKELELPMYKMLLSQSLTYFVRSIWHLQRFTSLEPSVLVNTVTSLTTHHLSLSTKEMLS